MNGLGMLCKSTRGLAPAISTERAVLRGLAPDGGLYMPQQFPCLSHTDELKALSYTSLCAEVLTPFFSHLTKSEIEESAAKAYARFFQNPPVRIVERDEFSVLELFHGPTLAFKDMALCLLPYLMQLSKKHLNIEAKTLLLTATSGDTGKAAMEGFADADGFEVVVFYPLGGVSPLQERQMQTQASRNTTVIGLEGNFDDAQRGVKAMLGNEAFISALRASGREIASANSINLGRLLIQIVYYVYAALRSQKPLRFSVPTGNFGNVLAAHWAEKMGILIEELLIATNDNCVLDDFFRTGLYEADRELIRSHSPSMDILVSSNLERLLAEESAFAVKQAMDSLNRTKRYEWKFPFPGFASGKVTEAEVSSEIRRVWQEEKLLLDPHTAVASALLHRMGKPGIVVATASPFKFPRFVLESLGQKAGHDAFDDLNRLSELSGMDVPEPIRKLEHAPITQKRTCRIEDMEKTVREVLHV